MALSLSAEQKSIEEVFYTSDQYIIPNYQRSYSWRYEQCNQMYMDFVSAFKNKNDYFIGNIVIARGQDERKRPQVVDGQQRLITLWLLLKTLNVLCPNLNIKEQYLTIPSKRKDGNPVLKIKSEVFETKDDELITQIFNYELEDFQMRLSDVLDSKGNIREYKCKSRFEYSSLLFFQALHNNTEGHLTDLTDFILEHVFLLPFELNGSDIEEANNKALTIFETINNRGMSLENADIFKAKLYNKALTLHKEESFKQTWADFRQSVEDLGLSVDDIFRYYSHIIRGRENIISGETNLRDFFLLDSASPIFKNDYQETMSDLMRIVDILLFLQKSATDNDMLGKWLQILNVYTNVYPQYVLVVYLFRNGCKSDDKELADLLESLVRYVYAFGASTTVKFEVYKMITKISKGMPIDQYYNINRLPDFDKYRSLRKGYALLYHYLNDGRFLQRYWFDKLIGSTDIDTLRENGWNAEQIEKAVYSIANTIVIDVPAKRKGMKERYDYLKQSSSSLLPSSAFFASKCAPSDFDFYQQGYNDILNDFFCYEES